MKLTYILGQKCSHRPPHQVPDLRSWGQSEPSPGCVSPSPPMQRQAHCHPAIKRDYYLPFCARGFTRNFSDLSAIENLKNSEFRVLRNSESCKASVLHRFFLFFLHRYTWGHLVKTPPAFLVHQCFLVLFQLRITVFSSSDHLKTILTSSSPDALEAPASKGESWGKCPRPSYLRSNQDAVLA